MTDVFRSPLFVPPRVRVVVTIESHYIFERDFIPNNHEPVCHESALLGVRHLSQVMPIPLASFSRPRIRVVDEPTTGLLEQHELELHVWEDAAFADDFNPLWLWLRYFDNALGGHSGIAPSLGPRTRKSAVAPLAIRTVLFEVDVILLFQLVTPLSTRQLIVVQPGEHLSPQ